jgi:hypothetical protein
VLAQGRLTLQVVGLGPAHFRLPVRPPKSPSRPARYCTAPGHAPSLRCHQWNHLPVETPIHLEVPPVEGEDAAVALQLRHAHQAGIRQLHPLAHSWSASLRSKKATSGPASSSQAVIAQNLSGASGCRKGRPSRSGRSRTSPPPDREPIGADAADVAAKSPAPGRISAAGRAWPRSPATQAARPGPSSSTFSCPDGNTRVPELQYPWRRFSSSRRPLAQAHSALRIEHVRPAMRANRRRISVNSEN